MSMDIKAVSGDKFTDEMLAKNFFAISDAFFQFENWSEKVDKDLARVADVVAVLSKKALKAKPRRGRFVVGVAVGVGVGIVVSPRVWSEAERRYRRFENAVRAHGQDVQKKQDAAAGQKYADVVLGDKEASEDASDN